MNRRITPYLLAVLAVLGLLALLSERPRRTGRARPRTAAVVDVPVEDVLRLRMKKDYWSSYLLARQDDGRWMMEEPSRAAVNEGEVRRLLETVTALPVVRALTLPGDDAEQRRAYGLWSPSLEITLTTPRGATTLLFGARTDDGAGVYAVVHGRSRVYVTTAAAVEILERNADAYRIGP